jgi:hypothetical protein
MIMASTEVRATVRAAGSAYHMCLGEAVQVAEWLSVNGGLRDRF